MNVTSIEAHKKICPKMSTHNEEVKCMGHACMLWQWDQELFNGPDSYIADPPPTGHCGLIEGSK